MILFSFYILNKNGLPDRFPKVIVDHFQNPHPYHLVTVNNRYCHNFSCVFNNNYDKEIFLLGDSNIATLQKPILNYSIKKDYKFTTLTHDGCSYVKDFEKISKITNQISGCLTKDYLIKRNLMLSNKNSIVVLGQRMPLYLSGIMDPKSPESSKRSEPHIILAPAITLLKPFSVNLDFCPPMHVTYGAMCTKLPISNFVCSPLYFRSCGIVPILENGNIFVPLPILVFPSICTLEISSTLS